jgi:hypothetical protein
MRTKGSVSHAVIKLSELSAKFGPDADIIVSRRFATANGLAARAIVATPAAIVAATPVAVSEPQTPEVTEPVSVTEVTESAPEVAEVSTPVVVAEVA